jgi:hypothetical protein
MDNQTENTPDALLPPGTQNRVKVANKRRTEYTSIPPRLEALYILFTDPQDAAGAVLTREELDLNPRTKGLPAGEKDLLVKYWPQFQDNLEQAREIRELREAETKLTLKADDAANKLRLLNKMDGMPIADQLDQTARFMHKQILKAAMAVAATDIEDVHSDELSKELLKLRIGYVKDFMWIARNLVDEAERIRQYDNATLGACEMPDEAKRLLLEANATLLKRGVRQ